MGRWDANARSARRPTDSASYSRLFTTPSSRLPSLASVGRQMAESAVQGVLQKQLDRGLNKLLGPLEKQLAPLQQGIQQNLPTLPQLPGGFNFPNFGGGPPATRLPFLRQLPPSSRDHNPCHDFSPTTHGNSSGDASKGCEFRCFIAGQVAQDAWPDLGWDRDARNHRVPSLPHNSNEL